MEYQQKYSVPVRGREGQMAHVYYLENPAHGYGNGNFSTSAHAIPLHLPPFILFIILSYSPQPDPSCPPFPAQKWGRIWESWAGEAGRAGPQQWQRYLNFFCCLGQWAGGVNCKTNTRSVPGSRAAGMDDSRGTAALLCALAAAPTSSRQLQQPQKPKAKNQNSIVLVWEKEAGLRSVFILEQQNNF